MDKKFTYWLLNNCTIKQDFYVSGIIMSWTLNKDYEDSWDGEDVKRFNSEEIHDYYLKIKK